MSEAMQGHFRQGYNNDDEMMVMMRMFAVLFYLMLRIQLGKNVGKVIK